MTFTTVITRWGMVIAVALLCWLAGCGKKYYPVNGSVTLDDGTPLSKGLVIFERVEGGPALTARGDIQPDGRYQLSTETPGDGVPVGRYKAVINPLDGSDVPDEKKMLPFHVKHVNFKTTDLEFEVKAGPNDIPIKLAPREASK